ncbi:hypothetical protein VNO77_41855 [Canavalia gladiata]|uniref:Uncharacterized protein n=1 Tax=Canavalia gladiata TaxID=3824 RepID=A0AAN9PSV2_CANGL
MPKIQFWVASSSRLSPLLLESGAKISDGRVQFLLKMQRTILGEGWGKERAKSTNVDLIDELAIQTDSTTIQNKEKEDKEKGNSNTGAIAGGVVAGAALLFAAPAIALAYWRRRKPQDHFFDVPG